MARLVLWMVDVTHPDPYADVQHHKRGDVVDVLPDGQHPGKAVEADPRFRVIDVPDMTLDEARSFCTPEPGFGDPDKPANSMLQLRGFRFDVDAAPAGMKTALERLPKQAGAIVSDRAEVLALKVRKPALADPKVLGNDGAKTLG